MDKTYEEIISRFGGDTQDSVLDIPTERPQAAIVYDASRSIVVKMPKYLDDMRHTDPQGAIDYLYVRKNKYKVTAYREFDRANKTEAKAKALETQAKKFKLKAEKDSEAAAWWRGAFCILAGIFAGLLVAALMISMIPRSEKPQNGLTRPSSIIDLQGDRRPPKGGKQSKSSGVPE